MPVDRDAWNQRIKEVERQYHAARLATERLRAQMVPDPYIAIQSPEALRIKETCRDLEVTYFIRMFAEFESGLRSFWRAAKPGRKPKTESLINGVASRRSIPNELLNPVHDVRNYRNQIVHDNEYNDEIVPIAIAEVRRRLILFFARLPFQW